MKDEDKKKKNTYEIYLGKTYFYREKIEANSEEEARRILEEKISSGEVEQEDYREMSIITKE